MNLYLNPLVLIYKHTLIIFLQTDICLTWSEEKTGQ